MGGAPYRHVKSTFGRGTRRKSVLRTNTCHVKWLLAKNLYFPNGASRKGSIESFNIELLGFSRVQDLNMTVQEIYEISAVLVLRFYFATIPKNGMDCDKEANDEEFIPATVTSPGHRSLLLPNGNSTVSFSVCEKATNTSSNILQLFSDNSLEDEVPIYLFSF